MKSQLAAAPDISIITCSYNQNRFLPITMASVLAQAGVAVEYLVVDGGSTDGSVSTIQACADRLAYWVSERDGGQSQALNKGLRRATGEIVGWLCSDDVLLPDALSRVVQIFREHPEVDAVYGNALLIDVAGEVVRPKREIDFHPWLLVGDHNYIPQPAMFWRRRLHDRLGFLREDLHLTMDLELWLRFAQRGCRVLHVDEYFAGMRCHAQQKVLVHPAELVAENQGLRAHYQPAWSRWLPHGLLHLLARTSRITRRSLVGGELEPATPRPGGQPAPHARRHRPMTETTSSPLRTIVLVEPICRGSRLQILANTLSALRGRANVVLVTRRDYQTAHFHELVDAEGLTPRIVAVDTDLGGAWMRNLTEAEFDLFVQALTGLEAELAPAGRYDLVFMALDDCLKAYALAALRLRRSLPRADMRCVKYRVEYLFAVSPGARLRGWVLRALTRWALWASGARLIAFDERLARLSVAPVAGLLPDPWFGPFSPALQAEGRAMLGLAPEDFALLSLGKQDRRKGIDFLIEAFPLAAQDPRVRLAVVGTIAADFAEAFEALKRRFPAQIVHVNSFVPESDLPKYFAAANAFLLPYSADFTATSGTLARAAASGVPVLATEHGLVGYRVKTYGLGATFGVGDKTSFVNALRHLRSRSVDEQGVIRTAGLQFADRCSLQCFEASMRSALSL